MELDNKIAFVTGPPRAWVQLLAIARQFIEQGAVVYTADISEEAITAGIDTSRAAPTP